MDLRNSFSSFLKRLCDNLRPFKPSEGVALLMTNGGNSNGNLQVSHINNLTINNIFGKADASLMRIISDQEQKKNVVAFEIGERTSGYACSVLKDIGSSRFTAMTNFCTSILFDPQQQFHSFGAEAEEEYARMRDENPREAEKWFYFERFTVSLHNNPSLTRDMELLDQTQKKGMLAMDVFSAAIFHLKKEFTKELKKNGVLLQDDEITWVLTIRANWEDQARHFMKEAAQKAGIPEKELILIPEPEAGYVYILAFYKANPDLMKPSSAGKGDQFMMVNLGGRTTDISVAETTATGNFIHNLRPVGTAVGVSVDDEFKDFLIDLVGYDVVASLKHLERLHLCRSLERTERTFKVCDEEARIEIPPSVIKSLSVSIASSEKYSKRVGITGNVLSVAGDLFLSFYAQATAGVTAAIRHALATNHVDAIFLVGGFSESDVIQNAVQRAFPEVQVVMAPSVSQSVEGCPPFSGVGAVLMGAVMYGHDPQVIATRVSAYTYGIRFDPFFQEGVHDESRAVYREGKKLCSACFDVHICIGQEVEVRSLLSYKTYATADANQIDMPFDIYRTKKADPLYVDEEGVEEIGTMAVLMPDTTGGTDRKIQAAMMVGGTELKLIARNPVTQEEFSTTCEFLSKN